MEAREDRRQNLGANYLAGSDAHDTAHGVGFARGGADQRLGGDGHSFGVGPQGERGVGRAQTCG